MIIRARLFCFVKGLRCEIFPDLRDFFYACFQRGILVPKVAVRLVNAPMTDKPHNHFRRDLQLKRAGDEPDSHAMPFATALDLA